MTRRRQYQTGSVYLRTDGRWAGVLENGFTAAGKRRRTTVTAKTQAEVKRKLRDKQAELKAASSRRRTGRTVTVKSWAEEWLDMTQREVRPKTWATNRGQLRRWVIPTIGHLKISDVVPSDLRDVDRAMQRAGQAVSSRRRARTVVVKLLKDAVAEGHQVDANVYAAPARTSQARKNDRAAMELDEALAVIEEANRTLPHASRWQIAFLQGLRQGEALGLLQDATETAAGLLTVEWQLQSLPYVDRANKALGFRLPDDYEARHLEGGFHLVRPKTVKGERIIPLVPWAVDSLEAWGRVAPPNPHGLVWTRPDGRPITDAADRAEFKALQDGAGVRHPSGRHYHVHEIRNTTATLLLEAGVDPFVITAIMGHTDIETSRSYMRLRAAKSREAMDAVGAQLQPKLLSPPAAG